MISILGRGWSQVIGSAREVSALYVLAKNGRAIYVGQTSNLKGRIAYHSMANRKNGGLLRSSWDKAFFRVYNGGKVARLQAEGALIIRLKPKFNCPKTMGLKPRELRVRKKAWLKIKAKTDCLVRLNSEACKIVKYQAKKNSRSIPQEVNYALIHAYKTTKK